MFPRAPAPALAAATLALGLATQLFPYSTLLYDHAPLAAVSVFAFLPVARLRHGASTRASTGGLVASGAFAGLGVLLNHSAVLTALALLVYVSVGLRSVRAAAPVVAGGVIPALLLAGYQWWCFGDPLALPQHYQLSFFEASTAELLGSFEWPRLSRLPGLLFGAYRGFFF